MLQPYSQPQQQPAIDLDAIHREIEEGYINVQRHPRLPISIYNYSKRAQFNWRWNEATRVCRGLILDDSGHVVARPFEKFFSLQQIDGEVPAEPFEVFDKLDGSLGIVFHFDDQWHVSTRGSFVSDQAERGTQVLREKYAGVNLDPNLTYLVEIIYPQNRVVVDYGEMEALVLIGIIETSSGREFQIRELGFPLANRFDGFKNFEEILRTQSTSREGYVVRFESGQRVKLKFDEYLRLHRLLTMVTPNQIWESLQSERAIDDLIEKVPDEFYRWIISVRDGIMDDYHAIEASVREMVDRFSGRMSRREIADEILRYCDYPAVAFAMLDGKDYANQIWRKVKPEDSQLYQFRLA